MNPTADDQPEERDAGSQLLPSLGGHWRAWQEVVGIVACLADAVDRMHADGRIHGRISSESVTLGPEGEPTLAGPEEAQVRKLGNDVHTRPSVVAPECLTGESFDHRTDVYGLGVVLYQMLCGCEPFRSQDAVELRRQVLEDIPQPPRQLVHGIPREVESVCLQALSKTPDERFQSAARMADALRAALEIEDPGSLSSIQLASHRLPAIAPCPDFLIVEGRLELPGERGDRAEIESRWSLLAAECLRESSAEPIEWSAKGLLFRLGTRSADNAEKTATDAFLRLSRRTGSLLQGLARSAGTRLRVRVQVATLSDQGSAPPAGMTPQQPADLRVRGTRLQADIERDRIELTRRSLESVARWHACMAGSRDGQWRVGGGSASSLNVHVPKQTEPLPFVGRESQLSMLRARWTQACDGLGQIVLIIGEEGIGKTRLIGELRKACQRSVEDAVVIQWNCLPRHDHAALRPAIDWFGETLGLGDGAAVQDCRQRLVQHLEDHQIDSPDMVDALADLVGAAGESELPSSLTPNQRRKRTQKALLHWLKAIGGRAPALFIVEDLQWVDPTTLEWLSDVMEEGHQDGVLIVFSMRPQFETPWGSRAHQTQLALNPLTKRHLATVLTSLRGARNLPKVVLEAAISTTGGVPLAIEQFVDSLGEGTLAPPQPETDT